MPSVDDLKKTMPAWAVIEAVEADGSFSFRAAPRRPGGVEGQCYEIVVTAKDDVVEVSETRPGVLLPAACPARHINSNGTSA